MLYGSGVDRLHLHLILPHLLVSWENIKISIMASVVMRGSHLHRQAAE